MKGKETLNKREAIYIGVNTATEQPQTGCRLALGLAYHGQHYFGWQRQNHPNKPTIQAAVELALARVMGVDDPVMTACAGRTDKGVHAIGQVIHFDTLVQRPKHAWVRGTNSYLPSDISVQWAEYVSPKFHARFSAIERQYRYTIYNHTVPSPLWRTLMTWVPQPLNIEAMNQAAHYFIGEHDFSSFRASGCQSKTSWRKINYLTITRDSQSEHCIHIDVHANAFLHHMVRNIVGLLIMIGQKKRPAYWAADVLAARDRRASAPTAPPEGLCFRKVVYENGQQPL